MAGVQRSGQDVCVIRTRCLGGVSASSPVPSESADCDLTEVWRAADLAQVCEARIAKWAADYPHRAEVCFGAGASSSLRARPPLRNAFQTTVRRARRNTRDHPFGASGPTMSPSVSCTLAGSSTPRRVIRPRNLRASQRSASRNDQRPETRRSRLPSNRVQWTLRETAVDAEGATVDAVLGDRIGEWRVLEQLHDVS